MIFRLFSVACMAGCLGVVYFFEGAALFEGDLRIFHWPAMVLTLIGPMCLMAACSDFRSVWSAAKIAFGATPRKRSKKHEREAKLLQKLSKDYYTDGPEVFESIKVGAISDFVAKMFERLATRMPMSDIREFVEIERDKMQIRSVQAMGVFGLGVRLTPSIGMLGTILGMVRLLSSLQDPAQIGSHMSLALLTTFYGLFFSLVLWTPLQQKAEQVLDAELEAYNQTLRWLDLLEARKPSNYFADSVNLGKSSKEVA